MTDEPCDSWEDDTSTKWRGDKLLRTVGKLQQDEKVHRAYLVEGMKFEDSDVEKDQD